ncbi:MAG: hypothetical protein R2939_21675 [Kofleriaceae bacterium]
MISLLIAYLMPLLVGIGNNINPTVDYLKYLTPWGFKWMLLQPLGPGLLGGVAAMLGFTGLFIFAGMSYFSKRDL